MNSYVIITDGCADLPRDLANKMGIGIIPVTVTIDDQAPQNNETLDVVDFYRQLRDKAQAKTAATAEDGAARALELMESGMSRKDAARQAAKELGLQKNLVYDATLK